MKQRCPACGRLVGIKAGKIIAKHRSKVGTKNRNPGDRHPYCKESGRPYNPHYTEQTQSAVPAPPEPAPQAESIKNEQERDNEAAALIENDAVPVTEPDAAESEEPAVPDGAADQDDAPEDAKAEGSEPSKEQAGEA